MRASVVYVPTCQRGKSAPASHFYVLMCQRAKGVPIIQLGVPTCKRAKGVPIFQLRLPKDVRIFQLFFKRIFLFLNFPIMLNICKFLEYLGKCRKIISRNKEFKLWHWQNFIKETPYQPNTLYAMCKKKNHTSCISWLRNYSPVCTVGTTILESIIVRNGKKNSDNKVTYNYLGSITHVDHNSRRLQYSHVLFILL